MSVPPDIGYFLDCSVSVLDITPDIYTFQHSYGNATEIIDNFPSNGSSGHRNYLSDIGNTLENDYISWRFSSEKEKLAEISARSFSGIGAILDEFVGTYSNYLGEIGAKTLDSRALAKCDAEYGMKLQLGKLARYSNRVKTDLYDMSSSELRDIIEKSRYMPVTEIITADGNEIFYEDADISNTISFLKDQKKKKGIIKRSVKIAEKIIGPEPTRIFIGGGKLKVEGEHLVYELKKTAPIGTVGHGGSCVSVFDKRDIHLCDLCIYTPNVPVLDHISSIVMHIKSGNEEKILEAGNPYNISDVARKDEYLVNYLPEKKQDNNGNRFLLDYLGELKRPKPILKKELMVLLYKNMSDVLELNRKFNRGTRLMLA